MLPNNLIKNITMLRKTNSLSQEELAEKLNVSRQAISKWERGEAYPDIENLIAISELFHVTLDDLVNGTINETEEKVTEAKRHINISIGNILKVQVDDNENKDTDAEEETDNDDDDDDDGDDEDDDDPAVIESKKPYRLWYELPYPILVTIAYLLWGFLGNGWAIGWTLYLTIPVYYSIIDCIRRRKLTPFCYPVFITFVYLLNGMAWGLWHPWWILFITVPVFYSLAPIFHKKK